MTGGIFKYPRTSHIEGSRFQPGDEDLECVSIDQLRGRFIVVEEKLDGANCAISFAEDGALQLQSRGHFLTGGPRERQFSLLKTWAMGIRQEACGVLGDRYVLYGEWLYAKHTIFYDALTHYFQEFDVLDIETGEFLSTDRRHAMLKQLPVVSAPILWQGAAESVEHLQSLVGQSLFKSRDWRERLRVEAERRGQDVSLVMRQTDDSDLAEGLYIKVEEDGRVTERYKFVRATFLQAVEQGGDHWMERPILPNRLRSDRQIF